MGYYITFVVRIWCKDMGELDKGYVQHVGTQEQRYFLNMDDLTDFIRSHLSPPIEDFGMGNQVFGERTSPENLKDIIKDGREL